MNTCLAQLKDAYKLETLGERDLHFRLEALYLYFCENVERINRQPVRTADKKHILTDC